MAEKYYERPIGVKFKMKDDGRGISGQLTLTKGDLFTSNVVHLVDDEFFHIGSGDFLHGISAEGKVSLIDRLGGSSNTLTSFGDFAINREDVPFRYAVFGGRHITDKEECIRGIQFVLEEVKSNVFAADSHKTFGVIHNPDDKIIEAIKQHQPDYLDGRSFKSGAIVSYFTGNRNFLPKFKTVVGAVRAYRTIHADMYGRNMKDTVTLAIDFDDDPTTLGKAWEKMRVVRQFFAWMVGYVPEWKDVIVHTSPSNDDGYRTGALNVFGVKEGPAAQDPTHRRDSLIDASENPEHFRDVMRNWLNRNSNEGMDRANVRFFSSIGGVRYIEDGIVSAANAFDLLPKNEKPKPNRLPEPVLNVLKSALEKIKKDTKKFPEKESVLSDIGYAMRSQRLRATIEHRMDVVLQHYNKDELIGLAEVVRSAVRCRNYYTHGPNGKKEEAYFSDVSVVVFLTKTLEFIYGMSELLLCGWDRSKVVGNWHPLLSYVRDYDYNRKVVLKHLL